MSGNIRKELFGQPKCQFIGGKIQLQTEYPYYEPGQEVNGIIYLLLDAQTKCSTISLDIFGFEKAAVSHFWDEHREER